LGRGEVEWEDRIRECGSKRESIEIAFLGEKVSTQKGF